MQKIQFTVFNTHENLETLIKYNEIESGKNFDR